MVVAKGMPIMLLMVDDVATEAGGVATDGDGDGAWQCYRWSAALLLMVPDYTTNGDCSN
jgi:hypothetical protein